MPFSHRSNSGSHCRSGRNTIIDKDDGLTSYFRDGTSSSIELFTPLQFMLLLYYHVMNHLCRESIHLHNLMIEYQHTSRGNSTHREFLTARDSQFADNQDIQRYVKYSSNFKCNGHSSAR
jgi:hypothetical protein